MRWTAPENSREEVNAAPQVLLSWNATESEYDRALALINNWRACHAFPLNTFQVGLRTKTKQVDRYGLVAQRIKRLPAIQLKLRLLPNLRLTQMQDIGGCRAIVGSIRSVKKLHGLYQRSQFKHKLAHFDDYIETPRDTGYRGLHLVYRYYSDKNPVWNDLKVEMQLRTRLQHAWATAVETVGTFKQQPLKSGLGDEQWLRFFALMGSIMADRERTPFVPYTPTSRDELLRELRYYVNELGVIGHLTGYRAILGAVSPGMVRNMPYFLLVLNPKEGRIRITPYARTDVERASGQYMLVERQARLPLAEERDAVLVSVDSMNALRTAYPNYFADTTRFVKEVQRAVRL